MIERASAGRVFGAALAGAECHVLGLTDRPLPLAVERWNRPADHHDRALLDHCTGATVDVGCGPGRMTYELMTRGVRALGIDAVAEAVAVAVRRGAAAIHRDVFDPVPAQGRWQSVLLADGNIGIGGDPVRLLRRVGALIGPAGRVVLDVPTWGDEVVVRTIQLMCAGMVSRPFRWAVVPAARLAVLADAAALRVLQVIPDGHRATAVLVPDRTRR